MAGNPLNSKMFADVLCVRIPKDDEVTLGLPCQNCKLIEMGSMACYGDKCPDCGRPPPGKKAAAAAAAAASARTAGQR